MGRQRAHRGRTGTALATRAAPMTTSGGANPARRSDTEILERLDSDPLRTSLRGASLSEAMQVVTVMACVKVLADGIGTPKLRLYRSLGGGRREEAFDAPEYRVLAKRPNEFQTSLEFRRTLTAHAALTGGGLAIPVRANGELRELIPVRPGYWQVDEPARYQQRFRVYDQFGQIGEFGPSEVFYLPGGIMWDAVRSLDAVKIAARAIGLAAATEETQAALHANGGRPSGILSTDQKVGPDTVAKLKAAWREHQSSGRSGTAILDAGYKFLPMAMSGVDAQHLEQRRFQVEEICRAFGVFPIMVGHSDKTATFASSEAFFGAHVRQTLAPWVGAWEQRLDEFALDGAGPLSAEFDLRYLLAGSMKDRAAYLRSLVEGGILTRNEARKEEGLDPLPGLDEPLTPLNMQRGTEAAPGGEE